MPWKEIEQAKKENRKELIIQGPEIDERVKRANGALDPTLFSLTQLNFLRLSKLTSLASLPKEVGALTGLTSLILADNHLEALPAEVGCLTRLKLLDVSNNRITSLPYELAESLGALESLVAGGNKINILPGNLHLLKSLHVLDVSMNELSDLEPACHEDLAHLHTLNAKGNRLEVVPPQVSRLAALKCLDLSDNLLETVPAELGECPKLKELDLKGNKLKGKDRRFAKLVNDSKVKPMLDYIVKTFPKMSLEGGSGAGEGGAGSKKGKRKGRQGKGAAASRGEDVNGVQTRPEVIVLHTEDSTPTVTWTEAVQKIRPYIVCCIVEEANLERSRNLFKNFINAQTKLHETVCDKRTLGTIATHDLAAVKGSLVYDAADPQDIMITPLFKAKEISAKDLFKQLLAEADDYRKEHKRNTLSGIHKYLNLLKDKDQYPCLMDSEARVLSLPPLTNSDISKISSKTRSILVEVTSSESQKKAKDIMDALLHRMTELNVCGKKQEKQEASSDEDKDVDETEVVAAGTPGRLVVRQVRVVDREGNLKLVYPSRTDLPFDDLDVKRRFRTAAEDGD